ncbi:MAG: DinB family protein [Anaerolineales bacterium]|nr:DinB family protein [Anaerolineales bacterium]
MSELAHELADALHSEGEKTRAFFHALTPEQMQTQIYDDGLAWNTHDLLAHFVEVEGSIGGVIRRVNDGGEGVAADFNINRWNEKHTTEMSQLHEDAALLDEFARRRAANVEWVRTLDDTALERRGRHPALGETELKHMIKLIYIHLIGHQRDIKRKLQLS